jgi:hypothetical protein
MQIVCPTTSGVVAPCIRRPFGILGKGREEKPRGPLFAHRRRSMGKGSDDTINFVVTYKDGRTNFMRFSGKQKLRQEKFPKLQRLMMALRSDAALALQPL